MEFSPCPYITEATSDIEQAKCWAKRTTQRLKQKKLMFLFMKYLKIGTLQNTPGKLFISQHPPTHLNHKLNDIPPFFYYH